MSEERFRERRSAFVEDTENGDEKPKAEPRVIGSDAPADRSPPDAQAELPPVSRPQAPPTSSDASGEPFDAPDPSFLEIVELLAIQALQLMGENPLGVEGGDRTVHPRQAKQFIDLITVLQDKTRGNLEPGEAQALEQVLADLRVRYLRLGQS